MKPVAIYKSYPIFLSDLINKKYYALVNKKKVYFGQMPYEHYEDKIGYYSDLDHHDKTRRRNFKSRFERLRHHKGTSSWFADQILW